jgi:hypothetical protein
MPTIRSAAVVLSLLPSPALVWPWAAVPIKLSGPPPEQQTQQSAGTGDSATQPDAATQAKPETVVAVPALVVTPIDRKLANSEGKQTKRMFGIIPNFAAVSAHTEVPVLSTRDKFMLASKDSGDYSSFIWSGLQAAQSMALKSYPELHQGAAGYGRYYWRAFADQASGSFFTEAIVPALTREDPRYYTLGYGGFSTEPGTRYPASSLPGPIPAGIPSTSLRLPGMEWKRG